jgi:lysophospholipase L1-like esterase
MKKFGDILLVIGAGMLCSMPLIHFIRLGVKSSGDQILWLFAGTGVLFFGLLARIDNEQSVRSVSHKIVDCYKIMAILTLNALIVFGSLELASKGIFKARELLMGPALREADPREKSSYYSTQTWAAQYWDEFASSRKSQYHPFVVWRRAPFKGTTINIDQNGVRLTPGANCAANSFKVFTFGGSTMWGTGSPDWGTIPAYLQAGLEKLRKGPICVMNFGESAYVSTQSVVELLVQLQSGNVPNWVIFYDGPNDVYTGYQSGRTDVHENVDMLAARFENREAAQSGPLMKLLKSFHLFSLSDSLVGKLSQKPQASPKLITYESKGIDAAVLSESVVQRYLGTYKIVDGLAHEYGFKYFFFWPPHISMTQKPLMREEKDLKLSIDPALNKLYHSVYRRIEPLAVVYENLYYMAKIFDEYEPLVWLDDAHVTPEGNRLIAQKMLQVIMDGSPG